MRIGIDDRAIKYSGIGVYTNKLRQMLAQTEQVYTYEDNIDLNHAAGLAKYINFFKRVLKEQFTLPAWCKENKLDVYHATRNYGVPVFGSVPVVVTIHDVIPHVFPKQYLGNILVRYYYEAALRIAIWRAQKILTVSQFSKKELVRLYGVPAAKIVVTPIAASSAFKVLPQELLQQVRKRYALPKRYILTIGGSEWRKNVERLLKVHQKHFSADCELLVIGGAWRGHDLAAKYKDAAGIRFLSNLTEEDLVAIYNMAELFVFPSLYEGFGIPILEAMACETPVVTANVASMPEVGGSAAVYFDPLDEEDMAEKIKQVLDDEALCRQLVAAGRGRVRQYSWQSCAKATLAVYEEAVKK